MGFGEKDLHLIHALERKQKDPKNGKITPITLVALIALIVYVMMSLVCLAGCGSVGSSSEDVTSETTTEVAQTETSQTAGDAGAASGADDGTAVGSGEEKDSNRIYITDQYSYQLPDGFQEVEADFGERFVNQKRFISEDGVYQIRSFSDVQENFPFPDAVVGMFEGKDADIDYTEEFIFDELLLRVRHSETDSHGERFYFTTLLWMDGSDKLCWLEIFSPQREQDELAEQLYGSIGVDDVDSYIGIPQPTPNYNPAPSKEELDRAMLEDAQRRAAEQYEQDMQDEAGRMPYR